MTSPAPRIVLLDGPLGTELLLRGVPTPLPGWSAHALDDAPDVVRRIHADYAAAGAEVHTTNTFRTKRRVFPDRWEELARKAVALCREGAGPGARVAGSVSPLEDCYRPDLSPPEPRQEHAELARVLADAGCDLLLCETFPHVGEALAAVEACVATSTETWVSFTPGFRGDLLTPGEVGAGAAEAVQRGARAVLVNCVPVAVARGYVEALADLGVPCGVYANAGTADDEVGWRSEPGESEAYARAALEWRDAGATLIGGCCGTGPRHLAAVRAALETS